MLQTEENDLENGKTSDIQSNTICDGLPMRKKAIYMDEALSKIKIGKFNYILVLLSGTIATAGMFEVLGISFVLPVSQCDLNFSTKQKGVISTVMFLGIISSSHLWGYLGDTKGRRRVMIPTLLIEFCLSVCSSFTSDFYVLATLRFLNGFFMSASSTTAYVYLGEFHDEKQRGRAIVGSAIIHGVTSIFMSLLVWIVMSQEWMIYIPLLDIVYKPWRLFMVVCAVPALISAIALCFLPESPKYVLAQGNQTDALQILQKVNRLNNGKNAPFDVHELCEETESIENRRRILDNKSSRFPLIKTICDQTVPLFQAPYLTPTLLICTLQFLIYAICNGVILWFPEIMNRISIQDVNDHRFKMCEIINMPMNTSNLASEEVCVGKIELSTVVLGIIVQIAYVLGFVVIGLLINRVGKFPIIIVILTACGAGGIVCALSDVPKASIPAFIVLLCNGMAGNIISAAAVEIFPTNYRAMAISIASMFGRLGGTAGSNVLAFLIDNYCDLAFLLLGLLQLVAGILTFFVPKIHEKPTSPKPKENESCTSQLSISSCVP